MFNKEDWRLNGQEELIIGKTFRFCEWYPVPETNDHDHCHLCWDKFSNYSDTLHEGYVADNGKYWICPDCFEDLKDELDLKLEDRG